MGVSENLKAEVQCQIHSPLLLSRLWHWAKKTYQLNVEHGDLRMIVLLLLHLEAGVRKGFLESHAINLNKKRNERMSFKQINIHLKLIMTSLI